MWLILVFFGIAAIIFTILNVIFTLRYKKNVKWFRFVGLSLTALTLCASYSIEANWVIDEDWSALADVVPTMSKFFWILTIASIGINSISLWKNGNK